MHARLARWLEEEGWEARDLRELFHALIGVLNDLGCEIVRGNLILQPLHPLVQARGIAWHRGEEALSGAPLPEGVMTIDGIRSFPGATVRTREMGFGVLDSPTVRESPFWPLLQGEVQEVRYRIDPERPDGPSIVHDVARLGATDYLAQRVTFRVLRSKVHVLSLATTKAGGFDDGDLALLRQVPRALAYAIEPGFGAELASTLLRTYVGNATGPQVLAGRITRGDVESIRAALWFSDLRGFTQMSSSVEPSVLTGWLNDYFEVVIDAVQAHQGEVLKFIGDALLVLFPVGVDGDDGEACRRALAAARQASGALDALNASRRAAGHPPLVHGVGLHVGDALYGNIGSAQRLDFTVIGEAVNLAARIEGLCGARGETRLCSEAFASHLPDASPLGTVELKGLPGARAIFRC